METVGITSYGAYIPYYRLSRAEIARAWGGAPLPGERSVASYDEDSLTMATAAAIDCTTGIDRSSIDRLYFSSTSAPYKEKQTAAMIAAAIGLSSDTLTMDFSNSLRCGTDSILAAADAVSSGAAASVLVCTADIRIGYPNSQEEMTLGDGAAAIMLGNTGILATIEGYHSHFDEFLDVWRSDRDLFVHSWEDRFRFTEGYTRVVVQAVSAALKKYDMTAQDFSRIVFNSIPARQLGSVGNQLSFDPKKQLQDTLFNEVGNAGSASAMMSLVAALEEAKEGDRILVANYGDGCDVLILRVTGQMDRGKSWRGIKGYLAEKQILPNYQKYLRWRNLIQLQHAARPNNPRPSSPALWRDRKGLALIGARCKRCATVQYPAQRVCVSCGTKDDFEDYSFANRLGKIYTYSHDNLAMHPNPPAITAAVDFPEGGRIMCDVTDCDPREVEAGVAVEMTFRRLDYIGDFYNYWWKCRPVRF